MNASTHTTLQFLGAAETVTGSKFLLSVGDRRILIDDGMFQGPRELRKRNWVPLPFEADSITDVLLTHAHMDHVGMLPRLVKRGFRGPIFATEGTVRLAEIVLRDGAKIQEQDAAEANRRGSSKHQPALPLYTTADVEATLPLFVTVPFDEDLDLDDGIVVRYTRAAHILGSASITLWTPEVSVVFSGDLGRHDHPVLKSRGTPPGAPYALIESTYGDREHPEPELLPHEGFADVVRRTIERGGSVLVPAFAVDRTEVVLKQIAQLRRAGRIPHVPVYVDSPMANAALDAYRALPDELRDDLLPDELLEFPDLHSVRSPDESRELTAKAGKHPAIIIAASGMATGGRVLHHLEAMLGDKRHSVVLTGYQAVGTRGRSLVEGATKIKMFGQYIPVRAEIFQDREFSVHGDRSDLLDWLRDLSPRPHTVFCVHGEADSAAAFAEAIEAEFPEIDAIVPRHNEVVVLDGTRAALEPKPATARHIDRTVPEVVASNTPFTADTASEAAQIAAAPAPRDYRLLTADSAEALSSQAGELLAAGYVPFQAPSVDEIAGKPLYLQAFIRP